MGNRILLMVLVVLMALPISSFSQSPAGKVLPGTESKFIGHWVCESESGGFRKVIDVYKDGSLVIVHMHDAAGAPEMPNCKYVATDISDNKLWFKKGKDSEMLVVNDDGNHIYFESDEFIKARQKEK